MSGMLWDRQDGEPGEAFQGFEAFRRMPHPRRGLPDGFDVSRCRLWFREWLWDLRAEAWDEHLSNLSKVEAEIIVAETSRDRALEWLRIARLGRELVVLEVRRLLDRAREGSTLKPNELVKLAEFCFRSERLIGGELTDRVDPTVTELQGLDDDEIAEVTRLLAKAH